MRPGVALRGKWIAQPIPRDPARREVSRGPERARVAGRWGYGVEAVHRAAGSGLGVEQRSGVTARFLGRGRRMFWPVRPEGQRGERDAATRLRADVAERETGLARGSGPVAGLVARGVGQGWAARTR